MLEWPILHSTAPFCNSFLIQYVYELSNRALVQINCLDTFILSIWHLVMIFLLPVAVTNMSILSTTSLTLTTRYPSMQAVEFNSYDMVVWRLTFLWNVIILPWIAQSGSISVTYTTQPKALKALQHPLPTSPYPHTSTCLPASIESVTLWWPEIRFHH